jgi:hypothetical protein
VADAPLLGELAAVLVVPAGREAVAGVPPRPVLPEPTVLPPIVALFRIRLSQRMSNLTTLTLRIIGRLDVICITSNARSCARILGV